VSFFVYQNACFLLLLFPIIVSFSYICISQGSVATQSVEEFLKLVNIRRRYGQKFGGTFLWLAVYIRSSGILLSNRNY